MLVRFLSFDIRILRFKFRILVVISYGNLSN